MGRLNPLYTRAVQSLTVAAAFAAIFYALAWRRYFLKSAEVAEGPLRSFRSPDWLFTLLDRAILPTGFHRGTFRFIARTVARSDRHSAAFATILGIGVTVAFLSAVSPSPWVLPIPLGLLTANLTVLYSLLTGLRLAFGIPADLQANWIFRAASHPDADPSSLVKRTLWCFAAPVILGPAAFFLIGYEIGAALLHLLFVTIAAATLIELLAAGFHAVPFTCSWLPGRSNLIFATAGWAAGLAVFGQALAGFEFYFLLAPGVLIWFLLIAGAILFAVRRLQETKQQVAWSDTRGELDLLHLAD
jgi:hypothetical protein